MKYYHSFRLTALAAMVLGLGLAACFDNAKPVPEASYSAALVGRWQGTVGDLNETISFKADGTFACLLGHNGFIANTLSQREPGTVYGTWKIIGAVITLNITRGKNEPVENRATSSTFVAFNENQIVLKSDRGETSPFRRVRSPL